MDVITIVGWISYGMIIVIANILDSQFPDLEEDEDETAEVDKESNGKPTAGENGEAKEEQQVVKSIKEKKVQ